MTINFLFKQQYRYTFHSSNTYQVLHVTPNEVYIFQTKYTTAVGDSPYSDETELLLAKPCTPPFNLHVTDTTSHSIGLNWDAPVEIGRGVEIVDYEVEAIAGDHSLL